MVLRGETTGAGARSESCTASLLRFNITLFITINENLPSIIPCLPIILGARGIARTFDGTPIEDIPLCNAPQGRLNMYYAANKHIDAQTQTLITKATLLAAQRQIFK